MTDLADLPATDLLAQYRSKAISPVEVARDVLARIEAWDPVLHAFYTLDADEVRAAARASEARWASGTPIGPLDGVPITIKENIATKGTPMPIGTAATELVPAAADAPAAARVREAGAVILGKTTMPDYGMLSSGRSSIHPLARNPWDITKNPGGSSAGAGTAGAAGFGPLHLGTDIGGSVRLPAGWCGLVGLKPSFGRVPIDPPYLGRVAGPMTRNVADAALLMSVISAADRRDTMALPPAAIAWHELERPVRGLRIGLMTEAGIGAAPEPEVLAAVEAAARAFEQAGAIVEPMAPFLTRAMLDGLDDFWRARSWSDISALPPERRARILPYIHDWAAGGADLGGLAVYRGMNQMFAMRAAAERAFRGIDFALSPTAPMPAYAAELHSPIDDPQKPFEHIGFTVAANMSEQPAVSVNCGYTAGGLPIGLQITGQRFDDLGVLQMAKAYEAMRPAQRPWPRL